MRLADKRALIERGMKAGVKVSLHDSTIDRAMIVHPDRKQEVSWHELGKVITEAEQLQHPETPREHVANVIMMLRGSPAFDSEKLARAVLDALPRLEKALVQLDERWIVTRAQQRLLVAKMHTLETLARDRDDIEEAATKTLPSRSRAALMRTIENYRALCTNVASLASEILTGLGEGAR